jgi:hypothetical protein
MCEACAKLLLISSVVFCPPLHPFQKFLYMEKLREETKARVVIKHYTIHSCDLWTNVAIPLYEGDTDAELQI